MKLCQHNIHPSPLILGPCAAVSLGFCDFGSCAVVTIISCCVIVRSLFFVILSLLRLFSASHYIFGRPKPDIQNPVSESYISSFKSFIPFSLLEPAKPLAAIYDSSSFQGLLGPTFLAVQDSSIGDIVSQ